MKLKRNRSLMGALLNKEPSFGAQMKIGDLVRGTVIEKTGNSLFVDVPPYSTGVVYGREYREAKDIIRGLGAGAAVTGKIVDLENEAGYVELSLREAGRERAWGRLAELKAQNETVSAAVVGANRGGLMVELEDVAGFLPVSQLSSQHYPRVKDGDKSKILVELQKFVGESLGVKIITVSPKEAKLIVSEKEVELAGLSHILEGFRVGDVIEGEVSGVVDFGAFVRFRAALRSSDSLRSTSAPATPRPSEGAAGEASAEASLAGGETDTGRETAEAGTASGPELEGLIHISELDYKLVTNPADVVKVGETVKAKIISIDRGRVSLSLKRLKDDPWQSIERRWAKGDLVQGKVIKLDRYGALIELVPGIHGLCHVSEFPSHEEMIETLRLEESYPFRITELKSEERKLMLSFLRRSAPVEDSGPTAVAQGSVDAEPSRGRESEAGRNQTEGV